MKAFGFTLAPIDPAALAAPLAREGAGGYASFEGRVRDQSDGRRVTGLDYEAFEVLAVTEGERIVADAVRRHGALAARCVHRLGALSVGEIAVWVGVAGAHRAEAFAACREIIDEIKHWLPIWKQEHYADGERGWVNCQHGAAGHAPARATFDYSRQLILPEIGEAGQRRLGEASVVVVGAGGLGSTVLQGLAGAGVGHLQIVDPDRVDATNLHRQPLFGLADVGHPKAEAAAARLRACNGSIRIEAQGVALDASNVDALCEGADVIVDCSDNFATKFRISDAAVRAGIPAVIASVYQYEGQLQVVRSDAGGSCLRCQWPEATRDGLVGDCRVAGVLGPVPAVLGSLQAMEVLKFLLGLPGQLQDEVLLVDLIECGVTRLKAPRNPDCPCCGQGAVPADAATGGDDVDVVLPLAVAASRGFRIVDIREPWEWQAEPMPVADHDSVPMGSLLGGQLVIDPARRYLLVCAHGLRSRAAAEALRAQGCANVWSLQGGLAARRPG